MFGAGKICVRQTLFELCGDTEGHFEKLQERFGDAVEWLLGLVHVVIDCQYLRGDSSLESLPEELLRAASKHVPVEKEELTCKRNA